MRLNIELARVGAGDPGPKASLLDLHNPVLDWVKLASGMGIEASRNVVEELATQFARTKHRGPRLIEVVVTGAVRPLLQVRSGAQRLNAAARETG
jgi:acetolactate synthase-1/2/3 large subunit